MKPESDRAVLSSISMPTYMRNHVITFAQDNSLTFSAAGRLLIEAGLRVVSDLTPEQINPAKVAAERRAAQSKYASMTGDEQFALFAKTPAGQEYVARNKALHATETARAERLGVPERPRRDWGTP